MRTGSKASGIQKLPDGTMVARAYEDTDPEIKKEIMARIPEDMRDAISTTVRVFGKLHSVGIKWR